MNEIAAQRPDFTDVCFITQAYALQFCGCLDANGNAPDPLPVIDDAPPWYVCDFDVKSDFFSLRMNLSYNVHPLKHFSLCLLCSNICGGPNGSDFWTIDPLLAEESVYTTVDIQAKCGFLLTTALRGAFTAG